MEEEPVGYQLEAALQREHGGEEVVEVTKRLKQFEVCVMVNYQRC